ncbi:hypothetical protein SERLA73DRAFT_69903 [Serpula lacrymans var. lacrymans S7.3]|uniref:F-box domain-containing protein n=2 Tax=Serpula lacrymans var. lacrymans TaxID=341189 RepID=F8PJI9_SERL3|nr:uncharacterized protein SERLADRAFT_433978 [Serpula lacrymans var. lacrymans S7.9]EGO04127.1 hypothetical protein SERLA73DRAFT_69903 [Serpula lacrymans var. lacrymans S7.3]EGO30059.1 hypothetical protein SERLADRAFT_433978 [Serpula lacrymans var. lacrymans S7.9]
MHKCLLVPDILSIIFKHILPEDPDSAEALEDDWQRSLAVLARTCRLFSDPALDVLWADLHDVEPILRCLPEDIWSGTGDSLCLRRPLCSKDLTIIRQYTHRVRKLQRGLDFDSITSTAHQDVYRAFTFLPISPPLFPNLQQLTDCRLHTNEDIPFFRRLIAGPSIKTAVLNVDGAITTFDASDVLSQAVCQWNQLEELTCDALLNKQGMYHLAALDSLRSLNLDASNWRFDMYKNFDYPDDKSMFPHLQNLKLCFTARSSGDACPIILRIFRSVPKQIHLEFCTPVGFDSIQASLAILGDKCGENHSLQKITVLFRPSGEEDQSLVLETIRPILRFSSMTDVNIGFFVSLSLDDGALRDIALAWPNLQSLHLNWGYGSDPDNHSRVSIAGLIELLALCPKLISLGIVLDTRILPAPTAERPGGGTYNQAITSLHLGDSQISDPIAVAMIFSDILPRLNTIVASKYHAKWRQVVAQLANFSLIKNETGAYRDHMSDVHCFA